ncbi:unnamed protein product [Paramecium pentaurelia]|uniref:CSD domain-containing protein n=1 Tax=Paramecium pentaurelia TaxID=43138 RepID=A0A8S1VYT8_9CILI|nr:unnamed protein product [Paramecium pentaurelia]
MYLTAKSKDNFYPQSSEEQRELNQQLRYAIEDNQMLKAKIRSLEQDIEVIKENEIKNIKHYEKREDDFMKLIKQEQERNKKLYEELEYLTRELRNRDDQVNQLEENIRTLNIVVEDQQNRIEEEKNRNKEIQDQVQVKVKKNDDILKDLAQLENKYSKFRTKLETENGHLKQELDKLQNKYKNKLQQYKKDIKQQQQDNNQLKLDKLKLEADNDQLYNLSKQFESQLGKILPEMPVMEKQNSNVSNELERMKINNIQLNEQLQQADYEISQLQQQLQAAIQHLDRTNQDLQYFQQENQRLKQLIDDNKVEQKQNEFMIEKMVELSEKQMDDLEQKFNKVQAQVNSLQHEKRSLLTECNNLKMTIDQLENNEVDWQKRVNRLKKENKELTRQLSQLDQNMREMIVEKHSELKKQNNNISLRQSRFSQKLNSQNQSYRSIRTNNILMSGTKDLDDDDDEDDDLEEMRNRSSGMHILDTLSIANYHSPDPQIKDHLLKTAKELYKSDSELPKLLQRYELTLNIIESQSFNVKQYLSLYATIMKTKIKEYYTNQKYQLFCNVYVPQKFARTINIFCYNPSITGYIALVKTLQMTSLIAMEKMLSQIDNKEQESFYTFDELFEDNTIPIINMTPEKDQQKSIIRRHKKSLSEHQMFDFQRDQKQSQIFTQIQSIHQEKALFFSQTKTESFLQDDYQFPSLNQINSNLIKNEFLEEQKKSQTPINQQDQQFAQQNLYYQKQEQINYDSDDFDLFPRLELNSAISCPSLNKQQQIDPKKQIANPIYTGRLKFFDEQKNYGFIVMDEDKSDIFVHLDDLQKAGVTKEVLKTCKQGSLIRFQFNCMVYVGKYKKSRKAVELKLLTNLQANNNFKGYQ